MYTINASDYSYYVLPNNQDDNLNDIYFNSVYFKIIRNITNCVHPKGCITWELPVECLVSQDVRSSLMQYHASNTTWYSLMNQHSNILFIIYLHRSSWWKKTTSLLHDFKSPGAFKSSSYPCIEDVNKCYKQPMFLSKLHSSLSNLQMNPVSFWYCHLASAAYADWL